METKNFSGKIYKITNVLTQKIYIGQTTKSIEERFKRHIYEAMHHITDTHLARAIRKYGPNNFIIQLLSTAQNNYELTSLEYFYITIFNTTNKNIGYNETNSKLKSGGNTYKFKSSVELQTIRKKLSSTKIGSKNPKAVRIKCKSIKTGKEIFFDSIADAQIFFNEKSHVPFSERCRNEINFVYKEEWLIAYAENEYNKNVSFEKNIKRRQPIMVEVLDSKEKFFFNSYIDAERFFGLKPKKLSGKAYKRPICFIIGNLKITKL